jgi:hypothetical protein
MGELAALSVCTGHLPGRRLTTVDTLATSIRKKRSSTNGKLDTILSLGSNTICHLNALRHSFCTLNGTAESCLKRIFESQASPTLALAAPCKRKGVAQELMLELISDSDEEIEPEEGAVRATLRSGGRDLCVSFKDRQCERSWRKMFGHALDCVH